MGEASPVDAESLDLIRIELPGASVEITREERGFLLKELCFVAGSKSIREALEIAGTTRTVALDGEQQSRLREALASRGSEFAVPDGITRLLAALNQLPTRWSKSANAAAFD
jgi:hypothetical protein